MKRREFIALLGGAAAAGRSRRARSSHDAGDRFLSAAVGRRIGTSLAAFRRAEEAGFVEGQNVAIEYRWADGQLIGCRRWRPIWSAGVAVIVATALPRSAAKAATSTIPIVFATGGDPVDTAWSQASTAPAATSPA